MKYGHIYYGMQALYWLKNSKEPRSEKSMFETDSWYYEFYSKFIFVGTGQTRKLLGVLENRC